ncbi:MAG: hypothetical protein M3N50_06470 [Pseudomonadota bacterium]|nr:hypothetical protein [Pseudomonadota bacterium]
MDVPRGYDRNGSINVNQIAAIWALELAKREILKAAKHQAERAELIVLKPRSMEQA